MKHWRWTRLGTISPNVGELMIPPGFSRWFFVLATSRKMPKLATSPHSIYLYVCIYIITYIYNNTHIYRERESESDKLNLVSIHIYIYIYNVYNCVYIHISYIYKLKLNYLRGFLYPQQIFPPCPPLAGRPSRSKKLLKACRTFWPSKRWGILRLITNIGSRIYQKGLRLLVY